jgi:hypothetical protein
MIQHPPQTKHVGDQSEGFLFASSLRSFEPEGWWASSSRVRYLTAVAFLPKRGCWHRSGLWPDQSSFWLNQGYIRTITADPTADRRRHRFQTMEYYGNEGLGANSHSLLCNGWRLIDRVKGQNGNSDRERATATRWHSDKSYTLDFLHPLVRFPNCPHPLEGPTENPINLLSVWQWADFDSARISWDANRGHVTPSVIVKGPVPDLEWYYLNEVKCEAIQVPCYCGSEQRHQTVSRIGSFCKANVLARH